MSDDEFHAYRARLDAMPAPDRARLLGALCAAYAVTLPLPAMLSTAACAKLLGVGVDTLEKWRANGDGPPAVKLGRTRYGRGGKVALRSIPRYRLADVTAWIDEQARAGGGAVTRRRS